MTSPSSELTVATPAHGALTFKGAIKSFDVEDPVNIFVHRPIQLVIARLFFPLGVTANQATLLSLSASLGAAAAIVHGTPGSLLLAGLLLFGSAIFDGVDGMLARARGVGSPAGHVFDGAADYIGNVATISAGVWHLSSSIGWLPAVLLGVGAHVACAYHVMIYDFYVTHYLRLGVRSRSGAGVLGRAEQMLAETRAEGGSLFRRVIFGVYVWQLRNRDNLLGALNPAAAVTYASLEPTPSRAERYLRHHRWPMRATAWLGNAPHMDLFATCVAIGRIDLYFAARIFVFTPLAIGQIVWHRVVSARFLEGEAELQALPQLAAWMTGARATVWLAGIVGVVGLCYLPSLSGGYMLDDHALLMTLDELPTAFWHSFNVFGLITGPAHVEAMRSLGLAPWWSSPDFMINFWRPIPSLTHWLDFQLWGYTPHLSHALNVALFLGVVLLVHRLFTRLAPDRPLLALVGTAVFGLDECHAVAVQWISARSELIGSIFIIASLLAYLAWRRTGQKRDAVVSLACLGAALLSRETATLLPPLMVAYELFGAKDSRRGLRGMWARLGPRLPLLVVAAALVALFLAFFFWTGHGARSAYYINPLAAPGQYARNLVPGIYLNNALLVTGLPLHLLGHTPIADHPFGAAILLAVVVAFWWLAIRWLHREPLFRFFAAWLGVTMLLFTTGFPDPRSLFAASIPFAWIVARMIEVAWERRRQARGYKWVLGVLVGLNLVAAPILAQASQRVVRSFDGQYEVLRESMRAAVDYDHLPADGVDVFFLGWHQPEVAVLSGLYLRRELPHGASVGSAVLGDERLSVVERQRIAFGHDRIHYYLLSMMLEGSERVRVDGDRELLIRPSDGGTYFRTLYEELFTSAERYHVGQTFETRAFRATVQETDAAGRISSVRFRFERRLDSEHYRFMRWDGERFIRVHLAAPARSELRASATPPRQDR